MRHMRAMAQLARDDQAAFDAHLDAAAQKMAAATARLGELEESLEDLTNLPGVQVGALVYSLRDRWKARSG